MKTLAVVWHWLTTTRYTRRLEREIDQLRSEVSRVMADNDALLKALYPAIRAARTEYQTSKEIPEKKVPASFSW